MIRTLTFAALALASTAMVSPAAAQEADADTVVATVNGTEITLGHMLALRQRLPQQYQQLPDDVLFNGILDQLIQQTALAQSLSGEPDKRLELTLENETRALKADAALRAAVDEAVSEDALRAAYDKSVAEAEGAVEWNASHILVETEEEARAVIAELEGGADFATVAKEKSTGPSGPNGGELGWFGEGQMVPAFEEAVKGLSKGEISEPVETQFGWHVVKLNDSRDAETISFEDSREMLTQQLGQDASASAIESVTAAAEVTRSVDEIDPAVISQTDLIDN